MFMNIQFTKRLHWSDGQQKEENARLPNWQTAFWSGWPWQL